MRVTPLAQGGEQRVDHVRRGDDGRTRIEDETVLAEHARPPAGLGEPLHHGDVAAERAKTDRRGKPAEPGTNDDRVRDVST